MHKVRVECPDGLPSNAQVFLGDIQIYPVRLTLRLDPNSVPYIVLELDVHERLFDGQAKVELPSWTREALVALGWTPPDNAPSAS